MVAVIAGNGLGLDNSSLRSLGQGLGGQATTGQGGVAQYLNVATGNLTLQNADEGLIFDGLSLSALRTYNSQGQLTGSEGWLFGFSRSVGGLTGTLNTAGSTITRTGDDGSTVTYAYDASRALYVSQDQSGADDTLDWSATTSTWTWTDSADSQQETYDASGQLTSLSDTRSGGRYSFSYSGGQLSTITAGDGDILTFGYNTANQLITLSITEIPPGQTTAVTRQQVGYTYDAQGRLSTVTTTLGSDTAASAAQYLTTYTYDGTSDRVASVSQSDGTVVSYTYAADANGTYRVATITTGSGPAASTVTLDYDLGTDTTTLTSALGQAWSYSYNVAGQLSSVNAPSVDGSAPTTTYQYDSGGNLQQVMDADGGVTVYTYDARGNRLSAEDATGHTVSYTYSATDRLLSQTVYTVPAQGLVGQPGYVPPEGAQTTYYVYDASDRLNYVVDPLGNVTEHDYTTSNGLTLLGSTRQYVGVSYDVATLSPAAPPSLAALQDWAASAPVQSTLSQGVRIDYTYDPLGRGQLATQTQWATLDSSGAGILDAGTAITTYTYDAQGRLLHSGTQRGADRSTAETSSYAYDGLGRLVSRTDPLNQTTHYIYTDTAGGDTLVITQANGLTTMQVRNSAGQLVSSTSSASGEASRVTTYLYDAVGRNVATVDALGDIHYTFYDADGRVAGVVDAGGAVTTYRYDADGHLIGTTQYATMVDTSQWMDAGALTTSFPAELPLPTASTDDHTVHVLFDAAGRAIATIDAEGNVVTTAYDGEGHTIRATAYATALTPAQLTFLGNAPTWAALQGVLSDNVNDRTTYTVYDADGRAAASIDASGFVTTTVYDTAGRAVSTTAYATALTAAQRTSLGDASTLSALQQDLATSDNDQTTRAYYDGAGRLVAKVDAEGYLTTTAYDETSHTETTTRYAVALTAALTGQESVATLVALLGSTPAGEVATTTYDADGQVVGSTAADGTVTTYSYNAVGQLLSTTVTPAAGQGAARTTGATYDAFGETLTRIDGNLSITTYTYNALGQQITASDALGNLTYTYYDADGRVAYIVQGQPSGSTRNATGNVTAYTYNAFGQVTATRSYASTLTLTAGSSSGTTLNPVTATLAQVASAVAALPVSASDANGLTTYTYTLDGQLASRTDGLGYQSAYAYDAFGDRTQVQQQLSAPGSALGAANSTISTFVYDSRGEQVAEMDGVGTAVARTTSATYDAFGRVTSRTDGDGHVVTFGYDRLGRQVSRSQTVGGTARVTQTTYDAFDRVVTQSDALGNLTTYQYDLAQHKTLITTADGVTVTTVTDAYGDRVSVTDGAGNAATYTYDADGRVLTVEDALGNVSTNQYDADGELIRTTDATGHATTYSYDASGRVLTRTVDPDGLALVTTYAYDGEGRQLSVTDPTGTMTTYVYDADGHVLTQVEDAGASRLNLTTTYTYDGAGKTLTVTAGAGTADARTTQYVYDNRERLSQQIIDPGTGHLHLTTSYTYDANDNLTSVTDANGHRTLHVYSEAGEPIFTIDAAGAVTETTYDADGRITAVRTYATALTAAQLTALGHEPTATAVNADIAASAGDSVSYTAYNAEGQVRYRIDPLGHVTETRYDAAGRVSETLAYAHPVSVTAGEVSILEASQATALSSLTSLVSAAGNTDANAEVTLRLYDADGRTQFVVQQNTVDGHLIGIVSEQRYDAAGRIIATLAYGGTLSLSTTAPLSAQLTTSSVAQVLGSTPHQISQHVYDAAGRLRYTLDAANYVLETRYDGDGRVLEQLTYANAISVPATLTEASVAAAVTAAGTAGARISATAYDTAGRVHTTSDALGVNTTYTYDATGLVIQQADRSGAVTVTIYDQAGRKTLVQSPSVTVGSYSGTTLQTATQYLYTQYQYDGVGNVTAISQGAGTSAAAWTILSTTSYAYDAAGRQTITTYPGGTVTTVVTYNALGQAVVDKDANGNHQYKVYNGDGEVAYAIDADGYVTGTVYDAYGHATAITRYATALNTSAISGWTAGQPLSLAQLQQGLATSSSDRTITTTYDQRNQKIQVQQSAVSYVLGMGASAGTAMTAASPTTTYTYDAYGNQTSKATLLQAANGSTPAIWATTYTYYDGLNRAVMTIDPSGQYTAPQGYVTTTVYNAFGEVAIRRQFADAIATTGVTVNNQPASPAMSLYDRTTRYLRDDIGRKIREADTGAYSSTGGIAAGSSVTTLVYDDADRKLTVTVNGMTAVTQYDAAGRVVSVTAPSYQALVTNWQTLLQTTPADDLATAALYVTVSPVTTTLYDALGHALSTTVSAGGLSQQTRSTYDTLGRQATATDADGNVTTFHYDNNGHLTSQIETLTANGASSTVTTTCTYDADGQQLSTIVQRSGQSGYDSYTRAKYNAFGEITDKGDNLGYEAHYTYDNAGQLTSAPDAATSAIHTYAYDLAGHQVLDRSTLTGGSGTATTGNSVDLAGRVVQQTRPGNGATTAPVAFGYDRWGNVTAMTDAAGNVTQSLYDGQNHQIRETEPEVLVVSATGVRTWATPTKTWYYNVNGQLTGVTDENGHTSLNTYDGAGHLTIAQDATAAKTYTGYDALGRAVAQQTPSASTLGGLVAHITYTNYDSLDQVVAQGDFLLNADGTARTRQAQQSYLLNSHGDRIRVTDALGHAAYYDFDSQHRVIKSQTPVQYASGWSETFSYDVNGHKTRDTDANGASQTWVYDYFGRVTSHVDLSGASTTYAYDSHSGLLTSITSHWVPTGQTDPAYLASGWNGSISTQNYSYYADGQVAQLTDDVDGVAQAWDTYGYDANGNTVNDTHWGSDGTGQQQHLATLTTYDSHNRISTVTTKDTSTGVTESRETINYDAAGNRRAVFVQSAYGPTAAPISGTGGAPTVAALVAQTATAGQAWALSVGSRFTDNIGFGLTFTATQANGSALPSWMHFNSNGNFSGTPSANGSWSVTVTATDVNGQSVSTTFTVTVPVAPPVFTYGTHDELGSVGASASFIVPGATDANGSTLTYSANLSSGAALPSWLHFDASTLTFTGTPVSGSVGSYALTVTATAANGGQASETLTFTVISTPPVLNGTFADQTVPVTRPFAFSFSPSLFVEGDGDSLFCTAGQYQMVPQGEGFPPEEEDSPLPSWMTFYGDSLAFTGTPPSSALGQTFKLYIKANNPQGEFAEGYFTVTVGPYTQPAPVYHNNLPNRSGVIGGSSVNFPLPSGAFTESDGSALTYSAMVLIPEHELDYAVGGGTDVATRTVAAQWVALSTVGLSINATSGTITGVPTTLDYVTSTYGAGSTAHDTAYQIEIIATNAQSGTVAGTFTLSNSYAPPVQVTALTNHVANPGAGWVTVVPAGAFIDPTGHALTYSYTLSSGAALPGGLSWSGTSIWVGAVSSGSYAIKVTASGMGGSVSATFTLTVVNAAPVIQGSLSNYTGVKGVAINAFQGPIASDANGDAITYSASGLPAGVSFNASTRTFSGTPSATGNYTVTYTAHDSKGATASKTFVLTVNAPAPQPPIYNGGIPSSIYFKYGQSNSYTFAGHFTNPSGRALTYSLTGPLPTGFSFNTTTGVLSSGLLGTVKNDRYVGSFVLKAIDAVDGLSVSVTFGLTIEGTGAGTQVVAGGPAMLAQTAEVQTTEAQTETTGTTPDIQSFWFTYDADNRVAVSNGALVNGQVVVTQGAYAEPSSANQYDAAGNVTVRITNDGTAKQQRLVYDARNELVESDFAVSTSATLGSLGRQQSMSYDADGRQLLVANYFRSDARASATGTPDFPNGIEYMPIGGWLQTAQITHYNADGTVATQSSWGRDGDWQRAVIMAVNYRDEQLPNEYVISVDGSGPLDQDSITSYTGYDHVGNVTAYNYSQASQSYPTYQAPYGASYTVQYIKKDGYLEQSTSGTPTVSGYLPATDTSYYDAFGRRTAVSQTSDSGGGVSQTTTRVFAYDTTGQILQQRSGTTSDSTFTPYSGGTIDHYTYVEGQPVGMLDENGGIHVLDTLTGFSDGPGTQGYVVQAGDTLAGIAQAVYGNSQYGYLVADANGMTGDDDLVIGQAITLPSITTSSNTASTFKPYNPNEIIGSTTPSLPTPPPPPPQAGCSTLATIVIIAVIIVASIVTAGAAAVLMGAAEGTLAAGSAALVGGSVVGLTTGEVIAAAAIGGFVGNAAGQLAGDALGVSHGFSFGQALTAGVTAGLTAGIGSGIRAGASEYSVLTDSKGAFTPAGAAVFGAGSYASGVAAAEVTGQPEHFSWAGVAASAVSAGVTAKAGMEDGALQKLGQATDSSFAANVAGGLLSGGIDRETSLMLGDDHVGSWESIGEDAFGNALGNAAIGKIKAYEANHASNTGKGVVGHLTGPNGNSGYRYQDGFQTFAAQDGNPDGGATAAGFQDVPSIAGNGYDPNNPFSVWNQEGAGQLEQSGVDVNGAGGDVAVSASGSGEDDVSTSYSGMPLAGHVGGYVDYFVGPENSNPNASPVGSSDRLVLAAPTSAAATNDEIVSMIQQEEANGAPPYDFSNYTQSDALSYLSDYSHLGQPSNVSATNLAPISVIGTTIVDASDVAEYASEAGSIIEYSNMGLTAGTKLLVLSTLNRAKYLQAENMRTVASARELDPLAEVFRASSRSGSIIAKALPFARNLGYVGVAANAVETVADAVAAPTGNVPITVARDTTNFAAEGLAVAGGFEAGMAITGGVLGGFEAGAAIAGGVFIWTGPFDAIPIAVGGLLGAGLAAYEYNNYNLGDQVKNDVNYLVDQSVKTIDDIPHDYQLLKNNIGETVNSLNQIILQAEHPWGH